MKSFRFLPLVTEKSMAMAANNVYQFVVPTWATKPMIEASMNDVFGVEVVNVTTARYGAKEVRFRQRKGQTAAYKKATITLKPGQSIADFSMPIETQADKPATGTTEGTPAEVTTESKITVRSKSKKA